jgi:rhamnosyltransferase subunit B
MARFVLVPVGSHGDVHPFVGLGVELKRRGHDVLVITNGHFESLIRRAGLGFAEFGTAEQYDKVTRNADLWHPMRGFQAVMDSFLDGLPVMYETIIGRLTPGTVLVGSSLAFAARIAQEKLGVPYATVHLQPSIVRSIEDPPRLPGIFMPPWMPRPLRRLQWWMADTLVVDRLVGPKLNGLRHELGLPPVKHILDQWWHSPRLTIGLWPAWFAPPASDWPPQVRLTGFPLFDERGVTAPPAGLDAFLDAGDPPLVFTPGSAMRHGEPFFAAAVDACERLNRRGVLLTRYPEQLPPKLPTGVTHFDFVPLSQILPRAAALIHHGGIGTTAQGLANGVPQLIMPLSHDQPDNAARVQRLGVGDSLKLKQFTGPNVERKLRPLLESESVRRSCRDVASRFVGVDAIGQTCDLIETLVASPSPLAGEGGETRSAFAG